MVNAEKLTGALIVVLLLAALAFFDSYGNYSFSKITGAQVSGTCVHSNPTVTVTPSTKATAPGGAAFYSVTIINNDLASCGSSVFYRWALWYSEPGTIARVQQSLYVSDEFSGKELPAINPGASLTYQLIITVPKDLQVGSVHSVGAVVENSQDASRSGSAQAELHIKAAQPIKGGPYVDDSSMIIAPAWNMISVTPPMEGKSLNIINTTGITTVEEGKCSISVAWMYDASAQDWLSVQDGASSLPSYVPRIVAFNRDLVGKGMWVYVNNQQTCKFDCGLKTCQLKNISA